MKKFVRSLLWLSPAIIAMVIFFASLPLLAQLDKAVNVTIAAAVALFVMGWGVFVTTRWEGEMDEVQRAGQYFAYTKGAIGGSIITVLLLLPTPLADSFTGFLTAFTTGGRGVPEEDTVHMAMVFGFLLLSIMQTLGAVIAGEIWKRRIGWRS